MAAQIIDNSPSPDEIEVGRRYIYDGSMVATEYIFKPDTNVPAEVMAGKTTLSNGYAELERIYVRGSILFSAIDHDQDSTLTNINDTSECAWAGGLGTTCNDHAFYYYCDAAENVVALGHKDDDQKVLEFYRNRIFGEVVVLPIVDDGSGSGTADDGIEDTPDDLADNNSTMTTARTANGEYEGRVSAYGNSCTCMNEVSQSSVPGVLLRPKLPVYAVTVPTRGVIFSYLGPVRPLPDSKIPDSRTKLYSKEYSMFAWYRYRGTGYTKGNCCDKNKMEDKIKQGMREMMDNLTYWSYGADNLKKLRDSGATGFMGTEPGSRERQLLNWIGWNNIPSGDDSTEAINDLQETLNDMYWYLRSGKLNIQCVGDDYFHNHLHKWFGSPACKNANGWLSSVGAKTGAGKTIYVCCSYSAISMANLLMHELFHLATGSGTEDGDWNSAESIEKLGDTRNLSRMRNRARDAE